MAYNPQASPRANTGEKYLGVNDGIGGMDNGKGEIYSQDDSSADKSGLRENIPTEEENRTLRKITSPIPAVAYWLCAVEFAERASYYGVQPLFANFVNKKMPAGGNGAGAPAKGNQDTAGALGLGQSAANAVTQSFSMFVYTFPIFWGWLADKKTGRWPLIVWGVLVCGISHILMVGSGTPSLLQVHHAVAPFLLSVYILAVGAAMFKPNISPVLLDQLKDKVPVTKVLDTGEKVIVDPDASTERVMLWFYLLINVGGFMNVPTAYCAKLVGWWLAFLIPLFLYMPLPFLLWFLKKRLLLKPAGGSDLGWVMRICGLCLKRNGIGPIFRRKGDFFSAAKPSVIAQSRNPIEVPWTDEFVEDVRRAFQACGIFSFFPIQFINDNGLGAAANFQSTMLVTNGVPNDVISNFNSLTIILANPILNYGLYPFLRKHRIKYGPIARITTGLFISTLGGLGYTILNYYAYKKSPCGTSGSSETCVDEHKNSLVAPITIWWMAIPYALGGLSELFVNVPAYGLAYSRSPENMRGLVSSLNLFSAGIAYAIGLILSPIIRDPYLTWCFAIPTMIGAVATPIFWFLYRHIDDEEYRLVTNDEYKKTFHATPPDEAEKEAREREAHAK